MRTLLLRGRMRITKLVAISAALLSVAPIGASAQKSGAKTPQKTAIARSEVRELPADQQIIQALSRLTFGARPGDAQKVRAIGLDNWIDQQLHPNKINDDALNAFVSRYSALNQDENDLLRQWSEHPDSQPAERPDLAQVRPEITRISNELVAALAPLKLAPRCAPPKSMNTEPIISSTRPTATKSYGRGHVGVIS